MHRGAYVYGYIGVEKAGSGQIDQETKKYFEDVVPVRVAAHWTARMPSATPTGFAGEVYGVLLNSRMSHIALQHADLARISALSGHDLALLYQTVTDLLRQQETLDAANQNVFTLRLPLDACDHVRRLALTRRVTRSAILREAVLDYVRRHHA